ncbi:hypothetical protein J3L16_03335 [Alteromonas sp. 5E99-2]|uniref:hypothetical protein n=1 Tax=Alteromonas sp. 5E99-2 TaxID=2817683 RepID=UPI001A9849B3|nr:hypothetical protein [Alteromonas sp. 5E99-2]MBO1254718.1 hypothetical protein [Alteromonas sp. 5E99-2]
MKTFLSVFLFVFGFSLLTVNLYGLTQDIRPAKITDEDLRFVNDHALPFERVMSQLNMKSDETDIEFAYRATTLISKGLAHIHWERFQPEKFNQLVPIWENYFLYLMGKFTTIPEFNRYHFADYQRSLQRGIGICGDASMILSQVLNNNGIDNTILTYPGHVLVEASFSSKQRVLLDADFGVAIPFEKEVTGNHYQSIAQLYTDKGYTEGDRLFFEKMFQSEYQVWEGVKHFITKKYYFEKVSYALKWPLPLVLLFLSIVLYRNKKQA